MARIPLNDAENQIARLDSRRADLIKVCASAAARRAELAIPALDGDKKSLREVAEIDEVVRTKQSEVALINEAIARIKQQAAERQREQAEEASRAAKAKLEKDTIDAANAVLKCDDEIDKALAALKQLFERRRTAVTALSATRTLPGNLIGRLMGKFGPTSAIQAAGLRDFISLEAVPVQHIGPLTKTDAFLAKPLAFVPQENAPPDALLVPEKTSSASPPVDAAQAIREELEQKRIALQAQLEKFNSSQEQPQLEN